MSRCGRCKGKGWHQPIRGVGQVDCRNCKGTGVKVARSSLGSGKVSIPLPPGAWCVPCGDRPAVQVHHLIPQQRIESYVDPDRQRKAKADPRNGIPTCVHCHGGLDDESIHLHERELPKGFWAFVAEYDLTAALPRYLACGAAAETNPLGTVVLHPMQSPREDFS